MTENEAFNELGECIKRLTEEEGPSEEDKTNEETDVKVAQTQDPPRKQSDQSSDKLNKSSEKIEQVVKKSDSDGNLASQPKPQEIAEPQPEDNAASHEEDKNNDEPVSDDKANPVSSDNDKQHESAGEGEANAAHDQPPSEIEQKDE